LQNAWSANALIAGVLLDVHDGLMGFPKTYEMNAWAVAQRQ
jgi:hypothetical protein